MSSLKELQLELEVWKGKMNTLNVTGQLIQSQSNQLRLEAGIVNENIARLDAAIKALEGAHPDGTEKKPAEEPAPA